MIEETQKDQGIPTQTVFIAPPVEKATNGLGIAGFVLSIVAIFLGWIPVFGWIIWLAGLVLSAVGITKKPKGLAIAGLVISLIGIILLLFVFGALMAVGAAAAAAQ